MAGRTKHDSVYTSTSELIISQFGPQRSKLNMSRSYYKGENHVIHTSCLAFQFVMTLLISLSNWDWVPGSPSLRTQIESSTDSSSGTNILPGKYKLQVSSSVKKHIPSGLWLITKSNARLAPIDLAKLWNRKPCLSHLRSAQSGLRELKQNL